ncbi:MAG: thioesterase family protein [Myxococcales bacterium]|nr:thioesterase family protein [Myxococcales bacterium]
MPAFYVAEGDRFVSTELTRGPWSNDHQHAGPPGALLARALERAGEDAAELFLTRITIELLRPVPIAPLTVRTAIVRPGKAVQRLEAVLSAGDQELARASGLRIRRRAVVLPEGGASTKPPAASSPDSLETFVFPFFQHAVGYHRAVDVRFASGSWGEREVVVWARPTVALVEGEEISPLERTLVIVDAESGICPPLDPKRYTFVNPDLTVYFERPLEGEWLGLAARSSAHPHGAGIAESLLFDSGGPTGRGAQSLVVAERA